MVGMGLGFGIRSCGYLCLGTLFFYIGVVFCMDEIFTLRS